MGRIDIENKSDVDLDALVGLHELDAVDMDSAEVKTWSDEFQNAEVIRFRLDGITYMAVEDPEDGYRSSMKKLFVSGEQMKNIFPACKVMGIKKPRGSYHENDTLQLIDCVTGKVVLEVGTDNRDDYYPMWVASFSPENMAVNSAL